MKTLLIPILAAVSYAASILLAKVGLTRRHISLRDYIPGLFLFLSISSSLALLKIGGISRIDVANQHTLLMLLAVAVTAATWNVLFYIGVAREKLNSTEAIILLMPLATISVGWAFAPSDFNSRIAISALVATAMIAFIYKPKRVAKFDKYGLALLVAVVLMGLENVLAGRLLQTSTLSPVALYTFRTILLFAIFYAYYRPSFKRISLKNHMFMAVSAAVGTTSMILRFYGLRDSGIALTAVVLITTPVLVFATAVLLLNEKIRPMRALALLTVGALVIYSAVPHTHV